MNLPKILGWQIQTNSSLVFYSLLLLLFKLPCPLKTVNVDQKREIISQRLIRLRQKKESAEGQKNLTRGLAS